jgi:hypothetical protein
MHVCTQSKRFSNEIRNILMNAIMKTAAPLPRFSVFTPQLLLVFGRSRVKSRHINQLWMVHVTGYHAIKIYWRSRGIVPRIINLGTKQRRVGSFTPRPLYHWYPSNGRICDLRADRYGRSGEKKISPHCTYRESNPDRPARSPIIIILSYSATLRSFASILRHQNNTRGVP